MKKNIVIAVLSAVILILLAVIAALTFQLQKKPVAATEEKLVTKVETPQSAPKQKSKVRSAADIDSAVSNIFPDQPKNGQKKHKGLHEQTPAEAVESAWQALEKYRRQSPEQKIKTRVALSVLNGVLNAISFNASAIVAEMNEQQRLDAVERTEIVLENLNAIEQEVYPDMSDDEIQEFSPTIQSIQNLSYAFLNAAQ